MYGLWCVLQLSDGFKSGLADAMHSYADATKKNKKDAVDGIQSAVCLGLSIRLVERGRGRG